MRGRESKGFDGCSIRPEIERAAETRAPEKAETGCKTHKRNAVRTESSGQNISVGA